MSSSCNELPCGQVLGKVDDIDSKDGSMDTHIVLAHSDVKRARVKFSSFKFNPMRGWLTSEVHETVGGMQTTVRAALSLGSMWLIVCKPQTF